MPGKIAVLLFSFTLIVLSCNTTEPPPPEKTITLTLEDVSCIEAWIKLTAANLALPDTITLKQNNINISTINLATADTLLYIDSLLPGTNYSYLAETEEVTSEPLEIRTMDTTTHNFSWQTFEFGDPLTGNGSILYDVAIIDENNIWAVGEIYLIDSLGKTVNYNAVYWNGIRWELKRILYNGGFWTIRTILAFNENDIWFSAFVKYDGQDFIELPIPQILMGWTKNKIWGTSSEDLYVAGNNGNIAYYNGTSWQKIESGTDLPLVDIYSKNGIDIYISGAYTPEVKGVLLKGNSNEFSIMINSAIISENELFQKLYGELASVWVDELGTVYTGGNILFRHKNNEWNYVKSLPENFIGGNPGTYYRGFISSIRGNASNDYIIAGDRNTLKHFNGVSWQQLGLPYSPSSPIIWYSVEQKGSTAIAVGDKGSYAFIILLNK